MANIGKHRDGASPLALSRKFNWHSYLEVTIGSTRIIRLSRPEIPRSSFIPCATPLEKKRKTQEQ